VLALDFKPRFILHLVQMPNFLLADDILRVLAVLHQLAFVNVHLKIIDKIYLVKLV
jgi:hypothetical protein